jgi:hypothetical protein
MTSTPSMALTRASEAVGMLSAELETRGKNYQPALLSHSLCRSTTTLALAVRTGVMLCLNCLALLASKDSPGTVATVTSAMTPSGKFFPWRYLHLLLRAEWGRCREVSRRFDGSKHIDRHAPTTVRRCGRETRSVVPEHWVSPAVVWCSASTNRSTTSSTAERPICSGG